MHGAWHEYHIHRQKCSSNELFSATLLKLLVWNVTAVAALQARSWVSRSANHVHWIVLALPSLCPISTADIHINTFSDIAGCSTRLSLFNFDRMPSNEKVKVPSLATNLRLHVHTRPPWISQASPRPLHMEPCGSIWLWHAMKYECQVS